MSWLRRKKVKLVDEDAERDNQHRVDLLEFDQALGIHVADCQCDYCQFQQVLIERAESAAADGRSYGGGGLPGSFAQLLQPGLKAAFQEAYGLQMHLNQSQLQNDLYNVMNQAGLQQNQQLSQQANQQFNAQQGLANMQNMQNNLLGQYSLAQQQMNQEKIFDLGMKLAEQPLYPGKMIFLDDVP